MLPFKSQRMKIRTNSESISISSTRIKCMARAKKKAKSHKIKTESTIASHCPHTHAQLSICSSYYSWLFYLTILFPFEIEMLNSCIRPGWQQNVPFFSIWFDILITCWLLSLQQSTSIEWVYQKNRRKKNHRKFMLKRSTCAFFLLFFFFSISYASFGRGRKSTSNVKKPV